MKPALILVLVTLLLTLIQGYSQTDVPAGNVSGTWTKAASPYNIYGEIVIADATTLTIEPGVTVSFQGQYKLIVQGCLLAVGNQTDTIVFIAYDTTGYYNNTHTGWGGIRFENNTSSDSSKIIYCKIQFSKTTSSGVSIINFSKIIISHSIISNCILEGGVWRGAGIYCENSSPLFINNNITHNGNAWVGGGILCVGNSTPLIKNNIICYNNSGGGGGGLYLSNCSPVLINNIISNNSSGLGGGVFFEQSTSIMSGNLITNNTGGSGGEITFPKFQI